MGQYFLLVNVDRREGHYVGKLGGAIYDYSDFPLLELLLRPLEPQTDSIVGIWAGHRIITPGDYMGECPSGMLTGAEQTEINQFTKGGGEGAFYSFASETFQDFPARFFQSTQVLETRNDFVLRNLSLQIYVRVNDFERILAEKVRSGLGSSKLEFTLTTLILVNTSWSDDRSCSIRCPSLEIVPGPWAGDRLDVASMEAFEPEERDLWQDVTEEQVERAFAIVKGES